MKKIIYLLFLCLIIISCKNKEVNTEKDFQEEIAVLDIELPENTSNKSTDITENVIPNNQKIIKNGVIRFETSDLNQTATKIYTALKKYNGYIQLDSETKNYNSISRNIIIRVPNIYFEKLITDVTEGVGFFDEKQITSEDVTEQFIDLEARLKSKKELESRYLDLLKRANKISEIIEIENQINVIREEIEAKEGQLNYLKNKTSMSTLNITFYKSISESGTTVSYGNKLVNAFKGSVNWIPGFFIGLIYLWPLFVIGGGVYYFVRKKRKNIK